MKPVFITIKGTTLKPAAVCSTGDACKPSPAPAKQAITCAEGEVVLGNACHFLAPDDFCNDPVLRMGYVCQFRPPPPAVQDPAIGCGEATILGFTMLIAAVCR